jgi:hypothetical protein
MQLVHPCDYTQCRGAHFEIVGGPKCGKALCIWEDSPPKLGDAIQADGNVYAMVAFNGELIAFHMRPAD